MSDTAVFTFYRVACPVFSIFARRILRADGAKGEGAAAPVRYDGDGGRAFHLPDLSPAPSPEVPLNNNFDRQIGVVHISGFDRYLAKLSALPAVPLCDGRATRRLKPGNQPAGSPRTKQRFAFSSRLPWPRSFLVHVEPRVVLLPLFPTISHRVVALAFLAGRAPVSQRNLVTWPRQSRRVTFCKRSFSGNCRQSAELSRLACKLERVRQWDRRRTKNRGFRVGCQPRLGRRSPTVVGSMEVRSARSHPPRWVRSNSRRS